MYSNGFGRPIAVGATGGAAATRLPQTGQDLVALALAGIVLLLVGFVLLRVQLRARAARAVRAAAALPPVPVVRR